MRLMAATDINISNFSNESLGQIQEVVNATIKGIFNSKPRNKGVSNIDVKEHKDVASVIKALSNSTSNLELKNVIALKTLATTIGSKNFTKSFTNLAAVSQTIKPESFKGLYQLAAALNKLSEISINGAIRLRLGANTYVKTIKKFLDQLSNIKINNNVFGKNSNIGNVLLGVSNFLETLSNLDSKYRKRINASLKFINTNVADRLADFLERITITVHSASAKNTSVLLESITSFLDGLTELGLKKRIRIIASLNLLEHVSTKIGEFIDDIKKHKLTDAEDKGIQRVFNIVNNVASIKSISREKVNGLKQLSDVADSLNDFAEKIKECKLTDAQTKNAKNVLALIKIIKKTFNGFTTNVLTAKLSEGYLDIMGNALSKFADKINKMKMPTAPKVNSLKTLVNIIKGLAITMTATIAILTAVIAIGKPGAVWQAFGMMTAFIGLSIGLIFLLSKIKVENVTKSAITLGAMTLLIGGLVLMAVAVSKLADIEWSAFGKGSLMIAAAFGVVVIVAALCAGIGFLLTEATAGLGMLAVVAGAAIVVGVALLTTFLVKSLITITNKFQEFVENTKNFDTKTMWTAVWNTVQMFGALLALVVAGAVAGAIILVNSVILLPASIAIIGSTLLISHTIRSFLKLINEVNSFNMADIKSGMDKIIGEGGIFKSMQTLIKEFGSVHVGIKGFVSSIGKSVAFNSMFDTISKFIDLIQKFANLQYISGYTSDGKPIMAPFTPEMFKSASEAICSGFNTFIETASKSFEIFSNKKTPKLLKKIGKSLRPLIKDISKFTDIILTYSKGVVTGYDENGKPQYRPWKENEFTDAATAVTQGFNIFIETADKSFEIFSNKKTPKLLKKIGKSLSPLIKDISKFTDIILTYSKGVVTGYDENGKPQYRSWKENEFTDAATAVTQGFTAFIDALGDHLFGDNASASFDKKQAKIIKKLGRGIGKILNFVKSFVDVITAINNATLAVEFNEETGEPTKYAKFDKDNIGAASQLLCDTLIIFFEKIDTNFTKKRFNKIEKSTDTMIKLSKKMKKINSSVNDYVKRASKTAESINKICNGGLGLGNLSTQLNDALGEFSLSEKELNTTSFDNYKDKIDGVLKKYKEFGDKSNDFVASLKNIKYTQNSVTDSFVKLEKELKKSKINDKIKEMAETFGEFAEKIEKTIVKFSEYTEAVDKLRETQTEALEHDGRNNSEVKKQTTQETNTSNSTKQTTIAQNTQVAEGTTAPVQYVQIPQNQSGPLIITIMDGGEQILLRGEYKRS